MATVQDMLMQAEITNAEEMAVGDLISREVCFIPQQWDLERCAEAMLGAGVHCAPTLGMGGRVDAVISMGDICRAVFDADTELKSEYRSLASIAHVVNRPGMNGAVPIIAPDASVRDAVSSHARTGGELCAGAHRCVAPCDARVSNGEGATFRYFSAHEFMQALALGEASWSLPVADLQLRHLFGACRKTLDRRVGLAHAEGSILSPRRESTTPRAQCAGNFRICA